MKSKIIVAIPCYNEASAIGKVIEDFRKELPGAEIVVIDNNSTDDTASISRDKGAGVIHEKRKGKGFVIQSIFERLDGDVFVIVDGDGTYPAEDVHKLIEPVLQDKADMVVGTRLEQSTGRSLKKLHRFGNVLITGLLNRLFKAKLRDVLSGYRAISGEMAKSIPVITTGFEIETELTLQALERGYIIKEVPIPYKERVKGSFSKLSTFKDGYKILVAIAMLLRDHQPLRLFSILALMTLLISVVLFASAGKSEDLYAFKIIFAGVSLVAAVIFIATGLILSAIGTRFKELTSILRKK